MIQRRAFSAALAAGIALPRGAAAAAADWQRSLGYPTGRGPNGSWTDKDYRIGNYSGGYEAMVTEDERYTRSAAVETNVACCSGVTPRKTSGGFVWYPYSVSQIDLRPKAR